MKVKMSNQNEDKGYGDWFKSVEVSEEIVNNGRFGMYLIMKKKK